MTRDETSEKLSGKVVESTYYRRVIERDDGKVEVWTRTPGWTWWSCAIVDRAILEAGHG